VQSQKDERYISLKEKCVIYLIVGECSVGHETQTKGQWSWTTISKVGHGHIVENESTLHLRPYTAVVILYFK
jgi:hypothetical protein